MSQHDLDVANAPGATVRGDINSALQALASLSSGANAPTTTYANMFWVDTTNGVIKRRNNANTAWIIFGSLDAANIVLKSSTFNIGINDISKMFRCTASGIYDITFTAVATLTDAFFCVVKNDSAFVLTFNPNASEQINGVTTLALNPGESAFIWSDGSALYAIITFSSTGKQTIWIPAGAMTPRTTNGAARGTLEMTTNKNMVNTLDFDPTTQEFAQFEIAMPKGWNEGTITFIPYWSHPATATNFGVVWALQAVAISNDDPLDVAFGTEQISTDTGGTTNDSYVGPESAAITVAGSPAEGDSVQYQIKRNVSDGNDTLAVDAKLRGIKILYIIDKLTDD